MPDQPTLVGAVIGCGFVSQHHLEAWKQVEGAKIAAVCDLDPLRLSEASKRIPGVRAFLDANELFATTQLDFVEICTRPEVHRPLVELAARHGVHVLCQKPAAPVREDFIAMIEACEQAQVQFMIHENWRFRPWNRALRSEIEAGTIGRPIRLRLSHRDTRALRPDGFRDQPYFAGMPRLILFEMGPHLVDTARYLLGEVAEVSARLGQFGDGHKGEDLAMLTLLFKSGPLGLLDLSWCAPAEVARPEWALNETVVEGTSATLRLQPDGSLMRIDLDGHAEIVKVALPAPDSIYLDGYVQTQTHFLQGVRTTTPIETSGRDNLKTMDVVWTAYTADLERRTIVLSQ